MELLQLKYFCDAAREQNLSKTARKFHVPTSNISNAIKRLEVELGCELFEHFSNKISLNERGKNFYDSVSEAIGLIEEATMKTKEGSGEISGELFVRCKSNRALVSEAMRKFITRYPAVKIHLTFGEADMKRVDLLVSYDMPIEYKKKILLVEEDLSIAMRCDNPLAKKDPLTVGDLKDEKFITGLSVDTHKFCTEAGFTPNIAVELNDPKYVRAYVEEGIGIAFVPSYSWQGLFSNKIVLKATGNTRKTYAFIPAGKYISKATTEFLKFLSRESNINKNS